MTDAISTPVDLSQHYRLAETNEERSQFLFHHYNRQASLFENRLYAVAAKTITGYKGDYMEYATAENGLGFLFPKSSTNLTVSTIDGYGAYTLPPEIVGILCTALATLIMVEQADKLGLADDQHDAYIKSYEHLIAFGKKLAIEAGVEREYFELTD
ncbi:MAG: hypothetical protein AWU57_178 [Marinobacter sp. T13-3]|nr:MAG: hypothetical protein AWU57_178 [Marinobacter sp. T13-3]